MEPTNKLSCTPKVIIGVVFLALVFIICRHTQYLQEIWSDNQMSERISSEDDQNTNMYAVAGCNVAGVQFHGTLHTYYDQDSLGADDVASAENIMYDLEQAENTPNIQAILLEIDSYGGSPVAAEEVVEMLRNHITKPVIAQIREGGASAAYWIASASDHVIASAFSDVGSIGVTMSYLDESKLNEKEGYTYNQISSGKFKDSGDPEKVLTDEEKALFQRDVDIVYETFVDSVAKNRGMDVEAVKKLADGSTMMGTMAKEAGLIDEVGGYYEALDYIKSKYNVDPVVCW